MSISWTELSARTPVPVRASMNSDPLLPPGFEPRAVLKESPQGMVLHAQGPAGEVVLRIHRAAEQRESLAELELLASADHPGLARLAGHGHLEGWSWIAREWIAGETLTEAASGTSPARIGRLIAELTPALHALHEQGFLHGDLKPDNVIVDESGKARLTDFGLSRPQGDGRETGVSGSYFAIAPEVLLGGEPDARSDLFALGVMLHQLLLGRRTSAREFYASFPHVSFFEATQTRPDDLPEWAREVASALLELDPERRPSSALAAGRALATNLGIELEGVHEALPQLRVPRALGREEWLDGWIVSVREEFQRFQLKTGAQRPSVLPRILRIPDGEDPDAFLDHLALRAAIERIPVGHLDLSSELESVRTTAELDHWVRDTIGSAHDTCLFLHTSPGDQWSERAIEMLARTSHQVQSDPHQDAACLLVSAEPVSSTIPTYDGLFAVNEVPIATSADLRALLNQELNFESADELESLVRELVEESSGSNDALQNLLDAYVEHGWIVTGTPKPRARTGISTTRVAIRGEATALDSLSTSAKRLAALLCIQTGEISLDEAHAYSDQSWNTIGEATAELTKHRLIALDTVNRTMRATSRLLGSPPNLPSEEWRALFAEQLEREAHQASTALILRYLAGEEVFDALIDQARAHRARGCPELTIDLVTKVQQRARLVGLEPEPELAGELAAAWLSRGDFDRTELAISEWRDSETPRERAAVAFVDGLLARRKHEFDEASSHFENARDLGFRDHGELFLSRARLAYERRDAKELDAVFEELDALPADTVHARIDTDLRNIHAMHIYRNGDVDGALAELNNQLTAARARDDAFHEAGVLINIATIQRHSGHWERAIERFEAAERLYEDAGFLPGLAQVRALLGACLRESGRLAEGEPLLASSLEIRERLGDRQGHAAVLGMLGLLHADQGVPRTAMDELERGAKALAEGARAADAFLLSARLDEVRARVHPTARLTLKTKGQEHDDPRAWVARARTAWLRGDPKSAGEYAERALQGARNSNSKRSEEEATFLLAQLDANDSSPAPRGSNYTSPVIALDDEIMRLLLPANFDSDRARMLALNLAARGMKDRAVRLYWAIRARSLDERLARDAERSGGKLFTEIARGLSDSERKCLSKSLLGIPDPYPKDLEQRAASVARSGYEDREIELLLEISRSLSEQADLPELLGSIVECALALTGGKRGFIVLEENGELHFDRAIDSRRGDIAAPEVETSASVIRQSLEAGRPLRLSNAVDDPLLGSSPSVMDLELRSILSCPFVVRPGVRGVIYVDHKLQSGAFDDRTERLIAHLAHQAAVAIRQTRFVTEIQELNEQLKDKVVTTESDLRTARAALREAGITEPTTGLVGSSDAIRRVHDLLGRAAPTALPVLIIGPSGTGKELAARALHELGPRSKDRFVSENCASLPESLIESEFFGYKRGAFTGADTDREGMFERADGGTIFLDEIGELSLELQAKLLRVLETGEVRRLGDSELRRVDFRLLAATNRDLEQCVSNGTFRADLFYRLDALRIDMPSLADRIGDIPELVQHFLRQEEAKSGIKRKISKRVLSALCRRPWPGNVRELANEISRLCVLSDGDLGDPEAIRPPARLEAIAESNEIQTLAEIERRAILSAIHRCNGDKDRAAEALGISRAKIYQRLKAWRESESERAET